MKSGVKLAILSIMAVLAIASCAIISDVQEDDAVTVEHPNVLMQGLTYHDWILVKGGFEHAYVPGLDFSVETIDGTEYTVLNGSPTVPGEYEIILRTLTFIVDGEPQNSIMTKKLVVLSEEDYASYDADVEYDDYTPGTLEVWIDSCYESQKKTIELPDVGITSINSFTNPNDGLTMSASLPSSTSLELMFQLDRSRVQSAWLERTLTFKSASSGEFTTNVKIAVAPNLYYFIGENISRSVAQYSPTGVIDAIHRDSPTNGAVLATHGLQINFNNGMLYGTAADVTSEPLKLYCAYYPPSSSITKHYPVMVSVAYAKTVTFSDMPANQQLTFSADKPSSYYLKSNTELLCVYGYPMPLPTFNSTSNYVYFWTDKSSGMSVGNPGDTYYVDESVTLKPIYGQDSAGFRINPVTKLYSFVYGAQFKAPEGFSTTISEGVTMELRPDVAADFLELVKVGNSWYLQTKGFGTSNSSVISIPAGTTFGFTIVATHTASGQTTSFHYEVSVNAYEMSVDNKTVVGGDSAYYTVNFTPNISDMQGLTANDISIFAYQTIDGVEVPGTRVNGTPTLSGGSVSIGTAQFTGTEPRTQTWHIVVQIETSSYIGSYSKDASLIIQPTNSVDPTIVPTVQDVVIMPQGSVDGWYVATAVNPVNANHYYWSWDDGTPVEHTQDNQSYHYWRGGVGMAKVTLTCRYVENGPTSTPITRTLFVDDGSYNAYLGIEWNSPSWVNETGFKSSFSLGAGWPTEPEIMTGINSEGRTVEWLRWTPPTDIEDLVTRDLTYQIVIGTDVIPNTPIHIGVYDMLDPLTVDDCIEVTQTGYSVTVSCAIPNHKVLYDSTDNRDISWYFYQGNSVNSSYFRQPSPSTDTEVTYTYTGEARDVLIRITLLMPADNSSMQQYRTFYKTVSIPAEGGTSPSTGDLDENKRINLDHELEDVETTINSTVNVELDYENIASVRFNTPEGLIVHLSDNILSLTSGIASAFDVEVIVIFNDGTWGSTTFKVTYTDNVTPDPQPDPVEVHVNPIPTIRMKTGVIYDLKLTYKNVTSVDITPEQSADLITFTFKEGGQSDYAGVEIVAYEPRTYNLVLRIDFNDNTFGNTPLNIIAEASEDDDYPVLEFPDQHIESGQEVLFVLKMDGKRTKDAVILNDSGLGLQVAPNSDGNRTLYTSVVEDGKYEVKVRATVLDQTNGVDSGMSYFAIIEFNVIVGDVGGGGGFPVWGIALGVMLALGAGAFVFTRFI